MPYSSAEGKDYIRSVLEVVKPRDVLDIGPGSGTYGKMVRELPGYVRATAIEVFAPYVTTYDLAHLYDQVIIGDARTEEFPEVDVVILGDVLEHMQPTEAVNVWYKALYAARKCVILSIPTVEWPQGAVYDNEHEAHIWTASVEGVEEMFPHIDEGVPGEQVSVFVGRVHQPIQSPLPM